MPATSARSPARKPRATYSKRRSGPSKDEATVAGVRLTHPDRVLYPEDKFTKRDLAEYYERIADWILPYVVDRPLTLVRCPEGYRANASSKSISLARCPTPFAA